MTGLAFFLKKKMIYKTEIELISPGNSILLLREVRGVPTQFAERTFGCREYMKNTGVRLSSGWNFFPDSEELPQSKERDS